MMEIFRNFKYQRDYIHCFEVCRDWKNIITHIPLHFDFSNRKIKLEDFINFTKNYNVKSLNLSNCRFISDSAYILEPRVFYEPTDAAIGALATNCSRLQELDVSNTYLSNSGLNLLAENCHELRFLNASNVFLILDKSISFLAKKCHKLESVNLSNINITDESMTVLARNCPKLRSLNLSCCFDITDTTINAIAQNCPQLESLNISHCEQITGNSIANLAEKCPNLQTINVSYTDITVQILDVLIDKCPQLKLIIISNDVMATQAEDIRLLSQKKPDLNIFWNVS